MEDDFIQRLLGNDKTPVKEVSSRRRLKNGRVPQEHFFLGHALGDDLRTPPRSQEGMSARKRQRREIDEGDWTSSGDSHVVTDFETTIPGRPFKVRSNIFHEVEDSQITRLKKKEPIFEFSVNEGAQLSCSSRRPYTCLSSGRQGHHVIAYALIQRSLVNRLLGFSVERVFNFYPAFLMIFEKEGLVERNKIQEWLSLFLDKEIQRGLEQKIFFSKVIEKNDSLEWEQQTNLFAGCIKKYIEGKMLNVVGEISNALMIHINQLDWLVFESEDEKSDLEKKKELGREGSQIREALRFFDNFESSAVEISVETSAEKASHLFDCPSFVIEAQIEEERSLLNEETIDFNSADFNSAFVKKASLLFYRHVFFLGLAYPRLFDQDQAWFNKFVLKVFSEISHSQDWSDYFDDSTEIQTITEAMKPCGNLYHRFSYSLSEEYWEHSCWEKSHRFLDELRQEEASRVHEEAKEGGESFVGSFFSGFSSSSNDSDSDLESVDSTRSTLSSPCSVDSQSDDEVTEITSLGPRGSSGS